MAVLSNCSDRCCWDTPSGGKLENIFTGGSLRRSADRREDGAVDLIDLPIAATIKDELGIDSIFLGFGLRDNAVHSPNEKFDLDCLYAGSRTAAALYADLAKK